MELRLNAETQKLEITCKLKQLNTKYSKTLLIDENRQKLDKCLQQSCRATATDEAQSKVKQSKAKQMGRMHESTSPVLNNTGNERGGGRASQLIIHQQACD